MCVCMHLQPSERNLQQQTPPFSLPFEARAGCIHSRDQNYGTVIWKSLLWYEDTSTPTHTNTLRDRDGYNIAGDRNQAVPVLSDQNVMMLWIPKIPKWSGLFPTIDGCCRQLPKSSPECNKTKSMLHQFPLHEVIQGKKETGSQMKGIQRKNEERQRINPNLSGQ